MQQHKRQSQICKKTIGAYKGPSSDLPTSANTAISEKSASNASPTISKKPYDKLPPRSLQKVGVNIKVIDVLYILVSLNGYTP